MSRRSMRVGVIAEDKSDVNVLNILLERLLDGKKFKTKKRVGKGCGRIKKKCHEWTKTLKIEGCKFLIVLHDLDKNDLRKLREDIAEALAPNVFDKQLICIPVEELEAWWLSDPDAIKKALNLPRTPKISHHPETIRSPKEHIGVLALRFSQNKRRYFYTQDNAKIAQQIDFNKMLKCESFRSLYEFATNELT